MNPDMERFLNLTHLPQRLSAEEAARVLGLGPHEIPLLVSKGLLKPLGHPAPNAPKFFLRAAIVDLERDEKWHGKASDVLQQHWRFKNSRKQGAPDKRQPSGLQSQTADLEE
jgi:hypothetical protein